MRVYILLAVLVGFNLASNDETFINNLQKSEFGKTVLQTIQLELSSSQDATSVNVLNILKQMQQDLENEQSQDATQLLDKQGGCDDNISSCQFVITKADEQRATDERTFPLLQEEKQDKINQSIDKKEQEQRNSDQIEALSSQRKETKEGYEQRRDESSGLIATLQEAKSIISQLNGGSFLQKSEPIMTQIKQHQTKYLKSYPNQRGFHSFVSIMLEAMQDTGLHNTKDGTDKVVSIIQNLIESIYEGANLESQAEDQRQQDFISAQTRLSQENTKLEGTIAFQSAQVETMSQKLLELQNDIEIQIQISDNKTTEKNDWEQTCSDTQKAYDTQTSNRNEQLDIINQVIDIFENRFNTDVSEYIQQIKVE